MSELRSERIDEERAERCSVCGGDPAIGYRNKSCWLMCGEMDALQKVEVNVSLKRYFMKSFSSPAAAGCLGVGGGLMIAGHPFFLFGTIAAYTVSTITSWYWREVRPARRKARDFPKARTL